MLGRISARADRNRHTVGQNGLKLGKRCYSPGGSRTFHPPLPTCDACPQWTPPTLRPHPYPSAPRLLSRPHGYLPRREQLALRPPNPSPAPPSATSRAGAALRGLPRRRRPPRPPAPTPALTDLPRRPLRLHQIPRRRRPPQPPAPAPSSTTSRDDADPPRSSLRAAAPPLPPAPTPALHDLLRRPLRLHQIPRRRRPPLPPASAPPRPRAPVVALDLCYFLSEL